MAEKTPRVKRLLEVTPKRNGWVVHTRSSNGRAINDTRTFPSQGKAVASAETEAKLWNSGRRYPLARVVVKERAQ